MDSDQPIAEFVEVVVDFGIIEVAATATNLPHYGFAQLAFLRRRHHGLRRIAKLGKFLAGRERNRGPPMEPYFWMSTESGSVGVGVGSAGTEPYLRNSPVRGPVRLASARLAFVPTPSISTANAKPGRSRVRSSRRWQSTPGRSDAARPVGHGDLIRRQVEFGSHGMVLRFPPIDQVQRRAIPLARSRSAATAAKSIAAKAAPVKGAARAR